MAAILSRLQCVKSISCILALGIFTTMGSWYMALHWNTPLYGTPPLVDTLLTTNVLQILPISSQFSGGPEILRHFENISRVQGSSKMFWQNTKSYLYCAIFQNMPNVCRVHYNDVIMGTIASQITSLTTVYSTVYLDADQRKHQSSASLAFVRGIYRGPHKWPVTRKMFPFDDVIMSIQVWCQTILPIWWRHYVETFSPSLALCSKYLPSFTVSGGSS